MPNQIFSLFLVKIFGHSLITFEALTTFFYQIFLLFIDEIVTLLEESLSELMGDLTSAIISIYTYFGIDASHLGIYAPIIVVFAIGIFGILAYMILAVGKAVEDIE